MCDREYYRYINSHKVRTISVKETLIGAVKAAIVLAMGAVALIGILVIFGGSAY